MVGARDPVGTIDAIWDSGGTVAGNLWTKGGLLTCDFGFYRAGAVVWCLMGLLCVYAMFLIALSSIALAVLLALGPLFIATAVLRRHQAILRRLDRATGQLRLDHGADRDGGRAVAASRASRTPRRPRREARRS